MTPSLQKSWWKRTSTLFCLAALGTTSTTAVATNTRQLDDAVAEPSAAYALYSLPTFTVTFTSSYNTNGLPTDIQERNQLIEATLHAPLRIITQEFLMESFRIEIAKTQPDLVPSYSNGLEPARADQDVVNLHEMLDSFMTLDLQVAVRSSEQLTLTSNGDDSGGRRQRQRRLLQDFPSTTTTTQKEELLQFEADFFTTAAFLEPSQEELKPSNKEVAEVLGGWIEMAFQNDLDIYQKDLINSEVGVLKHLEQIHVQTDSKAKFDPFAIGTATKPTEDESEEETAPMEEEEDHDEYESPIGGWSPSEKLFFTSLVVVSLMSIAGLIWALHKFGNRNKELARMMGSEFSHDAYAFSDHPILGGRHSDEIMDILNASDRYLAEHRPDLLEAMQRTDHRSNGLIIPIANNNDDSHRPIQRRYVMAANPFFYLYGASYFHSERDAVERDRRWTRRMDPMDGVELDRESVPDDEDLDLKKPPHIERDVSGFMQRWFHNLVGSRTAPCVVEETGLVLDEFDDMGLVHDDLDEIIIEECVSQETLACDEDPSQYDFPYQDFPRQDGTPCLIYEETLNEEEEEQYLRNSRRDSLHSTTTYGINDHQTDDDFRSALSQHSMLEFHSNSFDRDTGDVQSVVHLNEDETQFKDELDEPDPSQFTDKLERLVAMRHRHYEKQEIVEKHREQRRQERARQRAEKQKKQQEEMQKRDRLLQRHSLELEIQELEAAVGVSSSGPNSKSSKVISPKDQDSTDKRQLKKAHLLRRTSSETDMSLSSLLGKPVVNAIKTNRSMDYDEDAILNRSSTAGARSDPTLRLIHSAQKPRNVGKLHCDDVFRSIYRTPTLSTSLSSVNSSDSAIGNTGTTLLPSNFQSLPVVSPASSMTDSSSPTSIGSIRSTPPLAMGSGSIRDGSSARKKKHAPVSSSASAGLPKGFQGRRTRSFSNLEEKKMDDITLSSDGSSGKPALPPITPSFNRPRRSNSNSPADVMVHGIYAQFAN